MGLRNIIGQWSTVSPITEENKHDGSYYYPIEFPKGISYPFCSYTRNNDSMAIAAISKYMASYSFLEWGHLSIGGTLYMIFIGY